MCIPIDCYSEVLSQAPLLSCGTTTFHFSYGTITGYLTTGMQSWHAHALGFREAWCLVRKRRPVARASVVDDLHMMFGVGRALEGIGIILDLRSFQIFVLKPYHL